METTRDKVLADIRSALSDVEKHAVYEQTYDSHQLFQKHHEGLIDGFVRAFTAIDGNVVRLGDYQELLLALNELIEHRKWEKVVAKSVLLEHCSKAIGLEVVNSAVDDEDLAQVEVSITDCECLVARTGTLVMSAAQASGRVLPVYTPIHIVVARESQVVYDLDEAILQMEQRYQADYPSAWYLVSGPSRTGDIEKTLVLGVHGPIEVYVFLIKE